MSNMTPREIVQELDKHIIGQQKRSKRVAPKAHIILTIKADLERLTAVNMAFARYPHVRSPANALAAQLPNTSWLTVSRSTTTHAEQPPP